MFIDVSFAARTATAPVIPASTSASAPRTQYLMEEISKGLFADDRKIGRRSEQKVRLANIAEASELRPVPTALDGCAIVQV
jgi:hypothetical protein